MMRGEQHKASESDTATDIFVRQIFTYGYSPDVAAVESSFGVIRKSTVQALHSNQTFDLNGIKRYTFDLFFSFK